VIEEEWSGKRTSEERLLTKNEIGSNPQKKDETSKVKKDSVIVLGAPVGVLDIFASGIGEAA
jgi:hypothetical protein